MCCLTPPLKSVPKNDWFCPNCAVEKKSAQQKKRSISNAESDYVIPNRPASIFTFENFKGKINILNSLLCILI